MVLMGRVCDNIVPFRISNTLERVEIFHPPPSKYRFLRAMREYSLIKINQKI